eukprot:g1019.t1
MDASPSASPLESSSDDEPQRCAILRGHKIFYVIATVAAVLLYVVGVMPNRKAEAESPDLVRKPLALGEIEMSDTAVLSTRPPEPEDATVEAVAQADRAEKLAKERARRRASYAEEKSGREHFERMTQGAVGMACRPHPT